MRVCDLCKKPLPDPKGYRRPSTTVYAKYGTFDICQSCQDRVDAAVENVRSKIRAGEM